jgi:hypothetical protein
MTVISTSYGKLIDNPLKFKNFNRFFQSQLATKNKEDLKYFHKYQAV